MKSLAIAQVNLRRLLRQRTNIFFLLVFPLLIVLLLGAAFGSSSARLGIVVNGLNQDRENFVTQLVEQLEKTKNLEVAKYSSESKLIDAVQHGDVQAGLVVPSNYNRVLTSSSGREQTKYFARPDSLAQELRLSVESVVQQQSTTIRVARFLEQKRLSSFRTGLEKANQAKAVTPLVTVNVVDSDGKTYATTTGRFDLGASTQLILFIFLTSLTSAGFLIQTRRIGISRRMLATPTSVRTVLIGEALGRFAIALTQALLIIVGSAILFGVTWGNIPAVLVLVLLFCLVSSGAGMLLGSALSNEDQAGSVSLLLGLGLAALGGSMAPIEVFPETMRTIAHVTPHAWANDAFSKILHHQQGLSGIVVDLCVLAGFALILFTTATWRLRKAVTSGA